MRSELARFHDQGSGDFDPETGIVLDPTMKKHKGIIVRREEMKMSEQIGERSETERHLKHIIGLIDGIGLSALHDKNTEQVKLLEKKKSQAKKLIENMLRGVEGYMKSVRFLDEAKLNKEVMSQETYSKEIENAENLRTASHNALISDINIVNRFILNNFGNISEENIEDWEASEEEAGRSVVYVKRIDFPRNVICTDRINIEDRKQITGWAGQVYRSLSELKKRLSE